MSLTEKTHRLSESQKPFTSRNRCQRCDLTENVQGWIEHDHRDQPQAIYLFLCKKCSDLLIEPHPRLYTPMQKLGAYPGAMDICEKCIYRNLSRCKSLLAMFNGGPGLKYRFPDGNEPSVAFMDGTRGGKRIGWREIFYTAASIECSGRKEAA